MLALNLGKDLKYINEFYKKRAGATFYQPENTSEGKKRKEKLNKENKENDICEEELTIFDRKKNKPSYIKIKGNER